MPRAAVALASTNAPRFRATRSHLVLIGIVVVAAWLVVVFARALTDVDRATARQQVVASESTALSQRLDADRRELDLVQTDAFQRLQARAFGMGEPGEQVFSLPADAPPPPAIVPLGRASAQAGPGSPLDAWLQLLFGGS